MERWNLRGELIDVRERGNPDHSPEYIAGRFSVRSTDECGEWEDAKSKWLAVMAGIAGEIYRHRKLWLTCVWFTTATTTADFSSY